MVVNRNEEGITATVEGVDALKSALNGLPDKLRKRVLLSALRRAAAVVRTAARAATPVLREPSPYRTKGLLKKRLSVRVSRVSKAAGNVGVFVNVRPANGTQYTRKNVNGIRYTTVKQASQRGARSPLDPFYWSFVNFGTRRRNRIPARRFLEAGADALPQALSVFEREVGPAIEKLATP